MANAAVTVGEGVTQIGANAWSGMGDSVAVNGTALSAVRYLAPGIGFSQPAGGISGGDGNGGNGLPDPQVEREVAQKRLKERLRGY